MASAHFSVVIKRDVSHIFLQTYFWCFPMKSSFFLLPFSGILLFLLFFPQQSAAYAKTGLMLWFYTLLPSLLPFIILSDFFIHTGLLERVLNMPKKLWRILFCLSPKGFYALFMGLFCGYPMGAKVTADLYRTQQVSYQEACYLLTFCNYPGPSFLSAYLCTGMLKRPDLLVPTYGILYTSGFLCSLLFRPKPVPVSFSVSDKQKEISHALPFGKSLDISIMNGFESITRLGGYIILFSIIQGILNQLLSPLPNIKYLIFGLTEITTGISAVTKSNLPSDLAYPLIMACTASGGLCVAAQTKSMLSETDLPFLPYLKGKFCCFWLALFLAVLVV